jgi:hypothetical protein
MALPTPRELPTRNSLYLNNIPIRVIPGMANGMKEHDAWLKTLITKKNSKKKNWKTRSKTRTKKRTIQSQVKIALRIAEAGRAHPEALLRGDPPGDPPAHPLEVDLEGAPEFVSFAPTRPRPWATNRRMCCADL